MKPSPSVKTMLLVLVAMLAVSVSALASKGSPAVPSPELVALVQAKLERISEPSTYDRTTIHGVLNGITVSNIQRFQMAIDKPATGKVDTELLLQLEKSRQLAERAALRGVAKAQIMVSYWYQTAKNGYPLNADEAVAWNLKAVEQGDPEAVLRQGYFLQAGFGVDQSDAEALRHFEQAAKLGYPPAQFQMGLVYKLGLIGVAENPEKAAMWYQKAAEKGEVIAQLSLGVLYEKGIGVKKNYGEALKWFRGAAEQGSSQAMQRLGAIYELGRGISPDAEQSARWYRLAASQGETSASDAYNRQQWTK